MSPETGSLTFTFTSDPVERAQVMVESMKRVSTARFGRILVRVCAVLSATTLILLLVMGAPVKDALSGAFLFVIPMLFYSLFYYLIPVQLYAVAKKWLQRRSPGMDTVTVGADGLTLTSPKGGGYVPWTLVSDVWETERFYLFRCGPTFPQYVPKHAMSSEAEVTLRSMLERPFAERLERLHLHSIPARRASNQHQEQATRHDAE